MLLSTRGLLLAAASTRRRPRLTATRGARVQQPIKLQQQRFLRLREGLRYVDHDVDELVASAHARREGGGRRGDFIAMVMALAAVDIVAIVY